jgi:hypothetical protein
MAVIYCFGIPAASLWVLNAKKDSIQKLQLLSESVEELENGGTLTPEGTSRSQRVKNAINRDLVSSATRRFPGGGGSEPNQAGRAVLKESLRKLGVAMKEEDPWLAGLSPLYKDYEFEYWWFEVLPPVLPFVVLWPFLDSLPPLPTHPR